MKKDSFAHARSLGIGFWLILTLTFGQTALAQNQTATDNKAPAPVETAFAPTTELFDFAFGYNYMNTPDQDDVKDLHGFDTNLFINVCPWLAFGGDFMAGFGNNTSRDLKNIEVVDLNRLVYMGGLRLSIHPRERVRLFLQALFGGVHDDTNEKITGPNQFLVTRDLSDSSWAFDASIGADWRLGDHLSWRVLQVGYLGTDLSSSSNNWRVSTGVVWSFGGREPLANAK